MVKRVDAEINYFVLISAPNTFNHMTLNKFLQFSMPQFPHWSSKDDKCMYFVELVGGWSVIIELNT